MKIFCLSHVSSSIKHKNKYLLAIKHLNVWYSRKFSASVRDSSLHTSVPSQVTTEPGEISPSAPLQASTKASMSADQILNDIQVNQLGETFGGGGVTSVSELAASGEWSEEKRKQIGKDLHEKHTLECVEQENELRAEEIKVILFSKRFCW